MAEQRPVISFEFFPPQGTYGAMRLWRSVERLAPLDPSFVSVTFGAGGSTRQRTIGAIQAIREQARLDVAGHLTCVGASRADVLDVAKVYQKLGCRRIVALRGDPSTGEGAFTPHPDGFAGSVELIRALKKMGGFKIAVGAYPEPHPEATDVDADVLHLKRKFDAGADEAITQFFFNVDDFLRFRDRAAAVGIDKPIIPGILPIEDFDKMRRFAARCGASTPDWMETAFGRCETPEQRELLSISIATELCDTLMSEGVGHLHLYTLNNPDLPYRVCQALGVEPSAGRVAVAGGCA